MLTQMTLATKTPDRRRVVHSNFLLLGIVAYSLSDVSVAVTTFKKETNTSDQLRRAARQDGEEVQGLPPDIVG